MATAVAALQAVTTIQPDYLIMDTSATYNTTNRTESEQNGETKSLLVLFILAAILTLLLNLLLILALVTLRSVHLNKSTRYFLIYRASCYLVVVLVTFIVNYLRCSLVTIFAICSGILVASSMLLQALDSFVSVFRPFSYKQIMTPRRAGLAILTTVTAAVGVLIQMILIEDPSYQVPCTVNDGGFSSYLVIGLISVMLMLMFLSAMFQMSTIFLIWRMNQVHPVQAHPTRAQIPGPVLEMNTIQTSKSNLPMPGPSSENTQWQLTNSMSQRDSSTGSNPQTHMTTIVQHKLCRSPMEGTELSMTSSNPATTLKLLSPQKTFDSQAHIKVTVSICGNNPTSAWNDPTTDNSLNGLSMTLKDPVTMRQPRKANINSLPLPLNSLPMNLNSSSTNPQRNRPTRRGRLVRLLTFSMIVTLICWVPRLIMAVIVGVYDVYGIERTALAEAHVKLYISIALDCILYPVIVLMLSSELRGAVKGLLWLKWK